MVLLRPNVFPHNIKIKDSYLRAAYIFKKGVYKNLPEEYKKFYLEWKEQIPKPVHYIPKEGKYEKDPTTGQIKLVQNFTLPLKDCPQMDDGIWGGESIVQGYVRKYHPRFKYIDLGPAPKFWIPNLHRGVIYSEVLNKHMMCVLTHRAIHLINENYGLDHYLLRTPACDLRNLLALKLKRKILQALRYKTLYPEDETKRNEVYDAYKHYLEQYTDKEIEWYGLTLQEACLKFGAEIRASKTEPEPLKNVYRKEFIEYLKETQQESTKEEPWWKRKLISYK